MDSLKTLLNGLKTSLSSLMPRSEALKLFEKKEDAFSGKYADLQGSPELAAVATSGKYGDLIESPPNPVIEERAWVKLDQTDVHWESMCYDENKFVGVSSGNVVYSEDGMHWQTSQLPDSSGRYSYIACGKVYGQYKYVVVETGSQLFYGSSDGINWQKYPEPETDKYYDHWNYQRWTILEFLHDRFVLYSINYHLFFYSLNGINWIRYELPSSDIDYITYGDGKFVIGRGINGWYSEDFINWTHVSNVPSMSGLTYGNNLFVGTGGSSKVYVSSDLISWTSPDVPYITDTRTIKFSNGLFVIPVSDSIHTSYPRILQSNDGVTWIRHEIPIGTYVSIGALVAGDNTWLIQCSTGGSRPSYYHFKNILTLSTPDKVDIVGELADSYRRYFPERLPDISEQALDAALDDVFEESGGGDV